MRMEYLDPRAWLNGVLADFNCQTGTLHRADETAETLGLVTQVGVPGFLLDRIKRIPFGKGIAGVAAATKEPVELCNLQENLGGVAEAGARATQVSGSLAVPVFSKTSGEVIGTLGVGMIDPHEFSEAEKAKLKDVADSIAVWLEGQQAAK